MQIVIDIPIDTHYHTKKRNVSKSDIKIILEAISKGIPIPKGHGNLFDENDFEKRIAIMTESMDLGYGEIMNIIDEIPTIIETD